MNEPHGRPAASFSVLIAILVLAPAAGCESLRHFAGRGHDLIENPGRSTVVRGPAAIGAALGYAAGIPIAAVVWPASFFKDTFVKNASQGDIWISPHLAAFDYGSGTGAALIGEPVNLIRKVFYDDPAPPPGMVPETLEVRPGERDRELDFAVRPPVINDTAPAAPAEPAVKDAGAAPVKG